MLRQEVKLAQQHSPHDLHLETERMLAGVCPHTDAPCVAHLTPCRAHSVPLGRCTSPYGVRHASSLNRKQAASQKFARESLENAKNQNSLTSYATQERAKDGRHVGV